MEQNEKQNLYSLSLETLQTMLNYLSDRPFGEVHQLVLLLQQAQPIKEPESKEGE